MKNTGNEGGDRTASGRSPGASGGENRGRKRRRTGPAPRQDWTTSPQRLPCGSGWSDCGSHVALAGAGSRNAYGVDSSMRAMCLSIRSYLHSAAGSAGKPLGPWTPLGPYTVPSCLAVSCISQRNIPLCHQRTAQRACLGAVTSWRPTEQKG